MSFHYKYHKSKGGYYWFKTSKGVVYRCLFTQSTSSASKLYGLDVNSSVFSFDLIRKRTDITSHFDVTIGETVGAILNRFFEKNPDSIITYICDDRDCKGSKRQAAFEKWFLKHNRAPRKILIKANVAEIVYLGAVMISTNPDRYNIESYFNKELNEFIQSEKSGSIDVIE